MLSSTLSFVAITLASYGAMPQSPSDDLASKAQADKNWQQVGGRFETRQDKASISFPAKLPERFLLQVELSAGQAPLHFRLSLTDGKNAVQVETWDDTLVALAREEFIELQRLQRGVNSVLLRLGVDRESKTVTAFSAEGKSFGQLKGCDLAEVALGIRNNGAHLVVESIKVEKWNGTPPGAASRAVIYSGPNGGVDWKVKGVDGGLSYWSTNDKHALVCNGSGNPAFLPIGSFPEQFELTLGVTAPPKKRLEWSIGFKDPGRARARVAYRDALRFRIFDGEDGKQLRLTTARSFEKADFADATQAAWSIRLLYKNRDEDYGDITLFAADGRKLLEIVVSKAQLGTPSGLALWAESGMAFSSVTLRKWDGK